MADVKIFEYPLPQSVEKYKELHGQGKTPLKVGVGLDGSDVVKKAMKTLKRLVNTDRGDSLSGLHIEDPVKHEFQPTLRPDFLHRQFDRAVYPLPANKLHWFVAKKEDSENTYAGLAHLATDHNVDLLVVGNIGRTQSKTESAESKSLGHIAESIWRLCQSSVCIVKGSSYELDMERPVTWVVSIDGGHASQMAFCFVLFRVMRPGDELFVNYFGTSEELEVDSKKRMLQEYRDVLVAEKIKGEVAGIVCENGEIPQAVLQQASKVQADFLVLGLAGYTHDKLGSVSKEVLSGARCSVIAIKTCCYSDHYEYNNAHADELRLL